MDYQVLALKYRPENFNNVIGQDHVIMTLVNAFRHNRTAHAYLFTGPRGVGKTTTARILAKAFNCLEDETGNPCNQCQNCTEIARTNSMDVIEIDGASNRGIDEIRNIRELVKYVPIHSKNKVLIIDEVHMLTKEAFNALLKTLEEPPPHVKFIFATTEPNKLLPTILSRCQRHDFHRVSHDDIEKCIKSILEKENITADQKTIDVIDKMSDGSMRDALSLLDQIIAYCGSDIKFEEASKMLGLIPSEMYFEVTNALKSKDKIKLLTCLQDIYSKGYSLSKFTSELNQHCLNLLICSVEDGKQLLDLTEDLKDRYAEESKNWDSKDLLRSNDLFIELETKLKFVQQPKIYFESMMLKLAEMDSSVAIGDIISRLSNSPGSGQFTQANEIPFSGTTEKNDDKSTIQSEKKKSDIKPKQIEEKNKDEIQEDSDKPEDSRLQLVKDKWETIKSKISEEGNSLSTFLGHGIPVEIKGRVLTLLFSKKYSFQVGVLKKNLLKLEKTFNNELGETIKLNFNITKNDLPEAKIMETEDLNPVTKKVLELFGGEIVDK
tara:strand:+ start:4012 stop:5661 length:1650 start_codon:yes stop_codon:yes gene_type:complete